MPDHVFRAGAVRQPDKALAGTGEQEPKVKGQKAEESNRKSEILSSVVLDPSLKLWSVGDISSKATDGRRTGSRSIALRRTDVNLPDKAVQAGLKPKDPIKKDNHQYTIVNSKSAKGGVDPQYEYDLNGNRTKMITPFGDWTYTYDTLDRVTSISNPDNETTTLTYDAISRRTSTTYDNGVVTSYTYDAASRLTNLITQDSQLNTLNSYTYTYDEVGNRLSMTDNDGTHNYVYSDVYRLISATHPQASPPEQLSRAGNPDESFTYDPVGNRLISHLSSAYVYDNLNRLLEDDGYTYSYDNNGNLTSKVDKVTSDTTTYQHDGEDRLIQVTTPNDIVLYQYDGFGRRIAKTVNGVVTKYVYDREDILFELDENNQIKARYTHGPGIDEPISVDRDTDGNGTLDTTYYYHYDGLGSVTALTDNAGNVAQTYVYDAFGKIVRQTGNVENSYTFTAREWDAEAGLYFYRARYYDTNIGRFIQGDPIGFNGGDVNFYVYVKNNPVNWVDPDGLLLFENLFKDAHYKRNAYNREVPYNVAKDLWDSSVNPRYHQQGCGNKGNVKYVSLDGSSENIFDSNHDPVNDPLNRGTYNFADPRTDPVGHILKDMLPYWIWGNSPDDPSRWYHRIGGTFNGN